MLFIIVSLVSFLFLKLFFVIEETISADWNQYLENARKYQYKTKIGWCFGMEILSLQFVVVTLILYILMFMAKDRPEPKN